MNSGSLRRLLFLSGRRVATRPSATLPVLSSAAIHTSHLNSLAAVPVAKPDGRKTCTLIPGDGVGPELVNCVKEIFEAANVPIDFEEFIFSEVDPHSAPFEDVLESIERNGICLKGSMKIPDSSPSGELGSLSMKLRRRLDLFANVVIAKSIHGIDTRHKNVDLIIIREQTEGEYSGIEHESVPGVVESLKVVTRKQSRRIAKFAFDYATKWGRKKVTAVHKANIMKLGDGLFLESCREVSTLYPRIAFDSMIVDNCTMQLVSNPHQFDVLVMPNLYGTIVSNVCAGLIGGAGVCPGASFSHDVVAYEPGARHVFDEAVGKNIANPIAFIMCGIRLLNFVGLDLHASRIQMAMEKVVHSQRVLTKDLGGFASTSNFTQAVVQNLRF